MYVVFRCVQRLVDFNSTLEVKAAERVFEGSLSMQFDCQMSFTFRWVTRIPLDAHSLFFCFPLKLYAACSAVYNCHLSVILVRPHSAFLFEAHTLMLIIV